MKKILILGSNGYLGSSLFKFLSTCDNYFVVGYQRHCQQNLNCPRIICRDFIGEDWESFFANNDFDVVIHLISSTTPSSSMELVLNELNGVVLSTLKLINSLKESKTRFIFASSGGTVYGSDYKLPIKENSKLDPVCSYGMHKVLIEHYLRSYGVSYGLDYKIMRIANPYGGWGHKNRAQGIIPLLVSKLFANDFIEIFGNTIRDYLYVDDLMQAFLCVICDSQNEHRIFNIGTGVGTSTFELIRLIEDAAGKSFKGINITDLRPCDVPYNVLDIALLEVVPKSHPFKWYS